MAGRAGLAREEGYQSPNNATDDTVKKLRLYARAGITHYWLVDSRDSTLTVMRWSVNPDAR